MIWLVFYLTFLMLIPVKNNLIHYFYTQTLYIDEISYQHVHHCLTPTKHFYLPVYHKSSTRLIEG